MFSKNLKLLLPENWSFTTRLTCLVATTIFTVLILMSFGLYWILVDILEKAGHQFLIDEVNTVVHVLEKYPKNFEALRQEVNWSPSPYRLRKDRAFFYYLRIVNDAGKTLMATPNMQHTLGNAPFPKPLPIKDIPEQIKRWRLSSGGSYLLLAARIPDSKFAGVHEIQIALDVTYQEQAISKYWNKLMGILLLSLIVSTLLGYLIAKRSIRYISIIAHAAKNIQATKIEKRLDVNKFPKEISSLACAFNNMLDRISHALKRIQQFSANLAHELRTPINNLMGEAEVALLKERSKDEYCKVIASNLEEYQRLSKLIENMLFLAKSENPQMLVSLETVDVRQQLETLREFYRALAEEQQVVIKITGNALLKVDPLLFRQAISNLLSNALQHLPAQGEIKLNILPGKKAVKINVSDNGSGIAAEHLSKIFDRFYQVKSSYSQHGGFGLGLSIVATIMEMHNGHIDIFSELGKGTEVVLSFPS